MGPTERHFSEVCISHFSCKSVFPPDCRILFFFRFGFRQLGRERTNFRSIFICYKEIKASCIFDRLQTAGQKARVLRMKREEIKGDGGRKSILKKRNGECKRGKETVMSPDRQTWTDVEVRTKTEAEEEAPFSISRLFASQQTE